MPSLGQNDIHCGGEYNIFCEQTEPYINILFILTLLLSSMVTSHQTHIKQTLSVKSSASRPRIVQVLPWKTCCVSTKLKCRKIKHQTSHTLYSRTVIMKCPQKWRQTPYFAPLSTNPRSRCFSWRCTVYLLPCIQLNNLSAAIATAEEHRAAPPACAMDVTRSNDQSEVPILLYEQCEDGGMEWVGFLHHASASNRTRGSSVFVMPARDWSRSFTFQ